jgi:hypothetical protein
MKLRRYLNRRNKMPYDIMNLEIGEDITIVYKPETKIRFGIYEGHCGSCAEETHTKEITMVELHNVIVNRGLYLNEEVKKEIEKIENLRKKAIEQLAEVLKDNLKLKVEISTLKDTIKIVNKE